MAEESPPYKIIKMKGNFVKRNVKINKKKTISMALALALMLTTMSGCTTFDNFKESFIDKPQEKKVTVQIGVYEPMSGADSNAAKAEIKGIELAHEIYPNVNGKAIELVYGDNASDINAAETAIKELVAREPAVILGSYGSVYSLIAADYIREAKIPAIAITNTNPLVTKNNEYYFRVCYADSYQGNLLARYVLENRKEKTAGVLIPVNNDAAMATATAFTDRIKATTGNEDAIIYYEQYEAGCDDFTVQLEEAKNCGVKTILLPGDLADSVEIIRQADTMGLEIVFLGDATWASDDFKEKVADFASKKNMAFVNFFTAEKTVTDEAEKFLHAYHSKYGADSEPEEAVALGYDSYIIALDAIEKAGDKVTGQKVMTQLEEHNVYQGASGEITFNNTGDPIKTAYICTLKDGETVSKCTIKPAI